jgi:S-adenosylmethionine-dependent methyltransferase
MYEEYIVTDTNQLQQIEDALKATYFKSYDQEFLATGHGREDIEANVFRRYNSALEHVVPWVAGQIDLAGKALVEIGCGTGSSTAAFSYFVKEIHAYDVDKPSVDGARARLEILDIDNANLHVIEPEQLTKHLLKNHSAGVDIILLYAVLEHQTIEERHATINQCWELLNEDGLLVVVDTPNLLIYYDFHTSLLPFMQMLPPELYARYSQHSPRDGFNKNFLDYESVSGRELEQRISRWGRGVSYHDFQLTLGKDCGKYLVCSGFEQEILTWVDVCSEEEVLRLYVEASSIDIPFGFTRVVLNLIFKKENDPEAMQEHVPENRFFLPFDQVWQQKSEIDYLTGMLAEKERLLADIESSKRWRYITFITEPYRKIKEMFCSQKNSQ